MPVLLHPRQKLSLDDTADACTEKYLFGDHRRKFNKCLSQLEQRIFPSLAHAAWLVKHIETRREEFWTDQYIEEKIQPPVFWEGTPWRWQRAGFQCHKDNFSDTLFIINAGLPILKFGPIGDKTRHQKKFHGCLKDIEVMSTNYLRKIWTGGATKEKQRRAFWANEYRIDNNFCYGFRDIKFWFCDAMKDIRKFGQSELKRTPVEDWFARQDHREILMRRQFCEDREALRLQRPFLIDVQSFNKRSLKDTWSMAEYLDIERNARRVTRYLKEKKTHQRVNMQVHRHGRCMNAIDGYGAATRDGHRVLRVTDNQLQIELEAEDRLKAFKVQVIEDRLTSVNLRLNSKLSRFSRLFERCALQAAKKAEGFMFAMWKTDNLEYAIRVRERWQWHCDNGTTLSEKGIKTHNAMLYLSKMDQKYGK